MRLSDFQQKQEITTAPRILRWWQIWWRSVEGCDL